MRHTVDELDAIANTGLGSLLGLTVTACSERSVTGLWRLSQNVLDRNGKLHHGAVSSVVETLASIAAHAAIEEGTVVGVSNNTDFFRSTDRSVLAVAASVLGAGPDWQVWTVTITDDAEAPVARGTVRLSNRTALDELERVTTRSA